MERNRTKTLQKSVMIAFLGALSFLVMKFIKVPVVPFAPYLKYDPSGIFALAAGFLFGPVGALEVCLMKTALRFLMGAGFFGLLSDLIAMAVMTGAASLVGSKNRSSMKAWLWGCVLGTLAATLVMIPANYVILYLERGMLADAVTAMMPATVLFNLLKGGLNGVLFMMIWAPMKRAAREMK